MATSGMRARARALAAPSVRRIRREVQWHRSGGRRILDREPVDVAPHEVARHATPLFRALAGVDPQLQRNKVVNLGLAIERLDELLLRPGQRFSFWRQVGKPTRRRGFLDGLVLDHGRATAGVGGGMCQLTNLVYWMTLHTPLTVFERWRHSYDVFPDAGQTQPFGSGATCAWPVLDLQIENTTLTTFRLGLHLTETELCGAWTADAPATLRYEVYESHHVMTNDAPGVFTRHNVLRRRVLDGTNLQVGDELVAMNQGRLMYQPFIESGR